MIGQAVSEQMFDIVVDGQTDARSWLHYESSAQGSYKGNIDQMIMHSHTVNKKLKLINKTPTGFSKQYEELCKILPEVANLLQNYNQFYVHY